MNRIHRSILLVVLAATTIAAAGMPERDGNSLSLTIGADGGATSDAVLDMGRIRNPGGRRQQAAIVARKFTVRVDRKSGERGGTATIRAFLASPDSNCTYRLNGVLLGTQPVVIDRLARIGETFVHRLEIEVPPSAPEGALFTSIEWELTTD